MKILIWTQYFWPETFHINQLVGELEKQGMQVTVLTGKPNYPDGRIFDGYRALGIQTEYRGGIEIIRLPIRARGKGAATGLILNYLSFVFSGYCLALWALRRKKFDVIFVYAPSPLLQALPAIFFSWAKGVPLALWVQDIWPDALRSTGYIKNRYSLSVISYLVKYIYRYSDSILIQSEGFRDSVLRYCNDNRKVSFFPNSAEEFSASQVASSDWSNVSRYFSVVFAGNIGVAQSCYTILEAARRLKDVEGIRFFIVGSGSMESSIAQRVIDEKLHNVELLGRVSSKDVSAIYAASSVLLLTLKADPALSSTVPSKFQSYLAAGKPIIASCNGQVAKLLEDAGAGLSCAAEDSSELAAAVLELFRSDPHKLSQMGACGKLYFSRNFTLAACASRLIVHLKKLVGG
ncbi:glycosyltransferase family 4 protein [Stutzerimonas kunmingensis]|uniref:glycosyltransferase family 4 protein n=1 Tax=Stutzerimonas kunmingensis TaxID=1211807 RepID=UPI0035CF8B22